MEPELCRLGTPGASVPHARVEADGAGLYDRRAAMTLLPLARRENLPHTSASAASRGRGTTPLAAREAVIGAITAKPLVHAQLEVHARRAPGQMSQRAFVVTMDTLRCGTQRTQRRGRIAYAQGERRRGGIDLARLEAQRGGLR